MVDKEGGEEKVHRGEELVQYNNFLKFKCYKRIEYTYCR